MGSKSDAAPIRQKLLVWYDENRRDLPWRSRSRTVPDPYRVWLSEVMLQQTRVETVKPYYERWLARYPDLQSLATAPLHDILKAWEGLGYYSRARNFHTAVREVAEHYGGQIPDDPKSFQSLPGVGRYTAGAVMSIAFGLEEPIVDGNVRRVHSRLHDRASPTEAESWAFAASLVRGDRPGDLNQALMELGALVCTPRSPRCESCPVQTNCAAYCNETVNSRPERRATKPIPTERHGVAVVFNRDKYLLVKRPDRGRLGGMWEFPGLVTSGAETTACAARRAARDLAGLDVTTGRALPSITHVFTHVRVIYEPFAARPADESLVSSSVLAGSVAWASFEQLSEYVMPRAQRRMSANLDAERSRPG